MQYESIFLHWLIFLVKSNRCRKLKDIGFIFYSQKNQTTFNDCSIIGGLNCQIITKQQAHSARNSIPVLI